MVYLVDWSIRTLHSDSPHPPISVNYEDEGTRKGFENRFMPPAPMARQLLSPSREPQPRGMKTGGHHNQEPFNCTVRSACSILTRFHIFVLLSSMMSYISASFRCALAAYHFSSQEQLSPSLPTQTVFVNSHSHSHDERTYTSK